MGFVRKLKGLAAAAVVAGAVSSAAAAPGSLTISARPTSNVACSAGVCMPTGANAVLSVHDLEAMLASSNVKVATGTSGNPVTDIKIAASLTWTSASTLTLDSFRAIAVNKPVAVAGTGGMTLITNDGGSGGTLAFASSGRIDFWSLSARLSIDGAPYTLVDSIASLAAGIAAHRRDDYALAKNFDASSQHYTAAPVAEFAGIFEGLGHTISNLSIYDMTGTRDALFAVLDHKGVLRNIALTGVSITSANSGGNSEAGALVAFNEGSVLQSSASGTVMGDSRFFNYIGGGLVGIDYGTVTAASAAVAVSGGESGQIGGLIGNNHGHVANSSASGAIFAYQGASEGGLIGYNVGHAVIENCFATGAVTGQGTALGGLVGQNLYAPIAGSHATGTVTGDGSYYAGGLVGVSTFGGKISQSWASGAATGTENVGGLVGYTDGPVSESWASGAASGGAKSSVGGLIGYNGNNGSASQGAAINSYATGNAAGSDHSDVGGLVGNNSSESAILASYATGTATGGAHSSIGGLAGLDNSTGMIAAAYWDTTSSGIADPSKGAGNIANDPGIAGLTNTQLQSRVPKGFHAAIWSEKTGINGGLPYLLAVPPPQ